MLSEVNVDAKFLQVHSMDLEEKIVQEACQFLNAQMQKAAQDCFCFLSVTEYLPKKKKKKVCKCDQINDPLKCQTLQVKIGT